MSNMLMLYMFTCAALTSTALGKTEYIENEYLLSLNGDLLTDEAAEKELMNILKTNYDVDFIRAFHAASLTVFYVRADYDDVMRAAALPEVKAVDQNGLVYTAQACSEQPSPGTWGLDRIDQRDQLSYTDPQDPSATYTWGERLGSASHVYVADTGIDTQHPDFNGRAVWGYTVDSINEPETDLNGHGTHCAGISSSTSYGVAKNTTVVAVKCLSRFGSGSFSDVIEGLDWILQDHMAREVAAGALPRSVVDLSLGGGGSNSALEDFIQQMFDAGIVVVVSAGGSFDDACNYTPARTPNATTVASTDISDSVTSSNWGTCLDLFAPGVQILSTWLDNSTAVVSGTSMAASHVVGVVARYQDSLDPAPTAQEVATWLTSQATVDALTLPPEHDTSPNLLLYAQC